MQLLRFADRCRLPAIRAITVSVSGFGENMVRKKQAQREMGAMCGTAIKVPRPISALMLPSARAAPSDADRATVRLSCQPSSSYTNRAKENDAELPFSLANATVLCNYRNFANVHLLSDCFVFSTDKPLAIMHVLLRKEGLIGGAGS